jgi:hypothetical protein
MSSERPAIERVSAELSRVSAELHEQHRKRDALQVALTMLRTGMSEARVHAFLLQFDFGLEDLP